MAEPVEPVAQPSGREVFVVHENGERGSIPEEQLAVAEKRGWRLETDSETRQARRAHDYGERSFDAFAQGAARSLTFGASDLALGAAGLGQDTALTKEFNEGAALAGEIGGALLPAGGGALGATAGKAATSAMRGAGETAGKRILGGIAGGAAEGAVFGAGQGVSKVALDESPATAEHVLSTIGSDILYGAAFGGAVGGTGSTLAEGARVAKTGAKNLAERMAKRDTDDALLAQYADLPEDIAKMDRPALAKAEADEVKRLRAEADSVIPKDHVHRLDRAALTAERKAAEAEAKKVALQEGGQVLDNLNSYVEEIRPMYARGSGRAASDTIVEGMPGAMAGKTAVGRRGADTVAELGERDFTDTIVDMAKGKKAAKTIRGVEEGAEVMINGLGRSKKRIMQTLDDPKGWLESPWGALSTRKALRKQEKILADSLRNGRLNLDPENRLIVENWLAKNRAMQDEVSAFYSRVNNPRSARLDELDDAVTSYSDRLAASKERPTSERMEWIDRAKESFSDRLAAAKEAARPSLVQQLAKQVGGGALASGMIGMGMPALAAFPMGFALAEAAVGSRMGSIGNRLARGAEASREAARKGVDNFLQVGKRAAKAGLPIASKVLTATSFATPEQVAASAQRPVRVSSNPRVKAYQARARELQAVTEPDPVTGKSKMTHAAMLQMADRLTVVGAISPKLQDEMLLVGERRLAFLADKLPKRPGSPQFPIGPDTWHPSEYEIAEFGRYVDAVENPAGVLDRMGAGKMTSEDAEALRTVYPEIYGEIQDQLMAKLPELRENLPFEKRLMLSIYFEKPIDPSMDPETMKILQGNYAEEPGTKGGTSPAPAKFTSLRGNYAPKPTPSQERGAQ